MLSFQLAPMSYHIVAYGTKAFHCVDKGDFTILKGKKP